MATSGSSTWYDPRFLRMLIENTNDIISVLDADGILLYESPSFERLMGYEVDELIGQPAAAYVHPDDVGEVVVAIADAMAEPATVHSVTFRFRHRDGRWRVLEGRGRSIEGPDGKMVLLVNSRDVTERVEIEAENRAQQQFLRSIYNESQLPIFVVDVSPEGELRFVGLNPAHEEVTGLKSESVAGRTPEELVPMVPPEAAAAIRANYERCIAQGTAISYEEMIPILGRETWWLTRLSPLRDETGRIYRIVGGAYPISERKQMEAELRAAREASEERVVARTAELAEANRRLRQSEASLRSLINAITEYSFLMTPEGKVVTLNETTAERMGLSVEDLLDQNIFDYLPPELSSSRKAQVRRVIESKKPLTFSDTQSGRQLVNSLYPVLDRQGNVVQIAVFAYDVTALEEAEARVAQQSEAFLTLLESFPETLYVADPDTYEVLFANDRLKDALGEDPVGRQCYRALQGLDEPCPFCTNAIILETGQPHVWQHYNDRLDRHYWITDQIVPWPDGRAVRFEVAIDDTNRVVAERALRASEGRYRTLAEASPDMIFTIDREDTVRYVNSNAARSLGVSSEEAVGKQRANLFPPEIAEGQGRALAQVFRTGESLGSESIVVFPEGEVWLQTELVPIVDAAGEVSQVMGVSRDITSRKLTEQEREAAVEALEQRNEELTRFNTMAVGREKRMIELKRQVNEMAAALGQRPPYDLGFLS